MTNKRDSLGHDDDFWNLDEYATKKTHIQNTHKAFSKEATEAIEITSDLSQAQVQANSGTTVDQKISATEGSEITRFIPPHKARPTVKFYTLRSYKPRNPLIQEVKICSPNPNDKLFPESNMFMRERRALLHKTAPQRTPVSYYSMSPRYSQMSRAQLSYYLWWRDNARRGTFLPADESYIVLYAYELVACDETEDAVASLQMLCSLLHEYAQQKTTGPNFPFMMCDLICDHALIHGLSIPTHVLKEYGRLILAHTSLPEFFIDLSEETRKDAIKFGGSAISMYDYRRSKFYTEETAPVFQKVMDGAMEALISDNAAFAEITSFIKGIYGLVTTHRHPFIRMVNIANRNISLEISYHQLSSMTAAITDAMRYSENKLREHLGHKGKLHVLAVNPAVKTVIDRYFAENYPPMQIPDRRRKSNKAQTEEVHEYDRFYDVPKVEISPERALEIERESWDTTKILTEAFGEETTAQETAVIQEITPDKPYTNSDASENTFMETSRPEKESSLDLPLDIRREVGDLADFLSLCRSGDIIAQRKFALAKGVTLEEIADRINEAAVNCFGDIVLEEENGTYHILDDYIDLF